MVDGQTQDRLNRITDKLEMVEAVVETDYANSKATRRGILWILGEARDELEAITKEEAA